MDGRKHHVRSITTTPLLSPEVHARANARRERERERLGKERQASEARDRGARREAGLDAGGPADLMLTHESPASTPVRPVQKILRTNPHQFPQSALEASAASRARVGQVWDAVRPELLAHGHMHVAAGGTTEDGRRVASLGRDGHEGNLGILDMQTLRMATPSLAVLRGMANQDGPQWTREQRKNSVAESLYSGVLDGRKPTPRALRDAQDYIDGLRSLEEIIEDVRRRYTRDPEEEE